MIQLKTAAGSAGSSGAITGIRIRDLIASALLIRNRPNVLA